MDETGWGSSVLSRNPTHAPLVSRAEASCQGPGQSRTEPPDGLPLPARLSLREARGTHALCPQASRPLRSCRTKSGPSAASRCCHPLPSQPARSARLEGAALAQARGSLQLLIQALSGGQAERERPAIGPSQVTPNRFTYPSTPRVHKAWRVVRVDGEFHMLPGLQLCTCCPHPSGRGSKAKARRTSLLPADESRGQKGSFDQDDRTWCLNDPRKPTSTAVHLQSGLPLDTRGVRVGER